MKKTKVIYWILTGLLVATIGLGAIFDALSAPEAVLHITKLGYPAYLVPFLGVAKLLAIMAILVPGFPKLKEWAYAGIIFDLVGALYSHVTVGDSPAVWLPIAGFLGVIAGSYIYYHKLQQASDANVSVPSKLATS